MASSSTGPATNGFFENLRKLWVSGNCYPNSTLICALIDKILQVEAAEQKKNSKFLNISSILQNMTAGNVDLEAAMVHYHQTWMFWATSTRDDFFKFVCQASSTAIPVSAAKIVTARLNRIPAATSKPSKSLGGRNLSQAISNVSALSNNLASLGINDPKTAATLTRLETYRDTPTTDQSAVRPNDNAVPYLIHAVALCQLLNMTAQDFVTHLQVVGEIIKAKGVKASLLLLKTSKFQMVYKKFSDAPDEKTKSYVFTLSRLCRLIAYFTGESAYCIPFLNNDRDTILIQLEAVEKAMNATPNNRNLSEIVAWYIVLDRTDYMFPMWGRRDISVRSLISSSSTASPAYQFSWNKSDVAKVFGSP